MDNIIVITQNVKLNSLSKLREFIKSGSETLVFSTQLVFENEAALLEEVLDSKCTFRNFSDLMTDADFQKCDEDAYQPGMKRSMFNMFVYYDIIKTLKNQMVVSILEKSYPDISNKLIVCDDLGLDIDVWEQAGYKYVSCEYYHNEEPEKAPCKLKKLFLLLFAVIKYYQIPIHVAYDDGRKYLFFGSLNRISYRLQLAFHPAPMIEHVKHTLWFITDRLFHYVPKNRVIRMSTLHEYGNKIPDHPHMNMKLIQDGYLPPNYSSKYLYYYGVTPEFYTWDVEGAKTFEFHHLPHRVIPFRKKLYLPKPNYPQKVRKVLCVASGAGDWTAVKNRSDEDKMMQAFGKVAALFPDIEFIYRCHPVWIHPLHQGVNSINRAVEYIHWLNLPNLKISSNIPNANEDGHFRLSYKRSSFEEDLKDVDIVFGEHSISMIDAAFKKILFCSVNVTGRRDFFQGITQMGFPHCESIQEIEALLNSLTTDAFKSGYDAAIQNYNEMTDKEETK